MRLSTLTTSSVAILLWAAHVPVAQDARAAQRVPKTVQEAILLRRNVMNRLHMLGPEHCSLEHRAGFPLMLLPILKSPDARVRAVGVEGFEKVAELGAPVKLDACFPYLKAGQPPAQRAAVLACCLAQLGGHDAGLGKKAEKWRATVIAEAQDILNADVCPPGFALLAKVLALRHQAHRTSKGKKGLAISEVIPPAAGAIFARRCLAVLDDVRPPRPMEAPTRAAYLRRIVVQMLIGMGEKLTGSALQTWYQVEPDATLRAALVDEKLNWSRDAGWKARRHTILSIAAKSPDKKTAAQAKKLLASTK